MPATSLVAKVKLLPSEKMEVKAQKVLASVFEGGTLADAREYARIFNRELAIIDQQGDGAGLRFPGSKDHTPESNAAAFVNIVRRGNIARASK